MEYIQIGFTKKTHGVSGEIKVALEPQFEDLFLEKERVFLEIKGKKMPFFLENARGLGELIVKFEDVKNREEALMLQSKGIFLPAGEIPEDALVEEETALEYGDLKGFLLADKTLGDIGTIESIVEMPLQELAAVRYKGQEILVPLNDHYIVSIDKKKRRVFADLPEGLLEL